MIASTSIQPDFLGKELGRMKENFPPSCLTTGKCCFCMMLGMKLAFAFLVWLLKKKKIQFGGSENDYDIIEGWNWISFLKTSHLL